MLKTYVALDLETTGLDPNRDAIIEVGALRFSGAQEIEVYSTFVNPGRRIPHFITELTGITDDHVAGAPSIRQVAYELQEFVGRDIVIGHNVGFDLSFLRRHDALTQSYYIDTFELAGILVPHAGRYSLSNLVDEVGLQLPEQTHRALDDARMAHALYVELFERAMKLPKSILDEIVRLAKHAKWPPRFFFQETLRGRVREGFQGGIGAQLAAQRGGDAAGPLFLPEVEFDPLEPRLKPHLLDLEELKGLLNDRGALCDIIDAYEYRPQQELMMESVAQAFNTNSHLMVEAGTGTGKSLAYLIPAVRWADQNDDRVVISTNTINLQEQLADKDLPLLSRLFPTGFRAMVLKGRSHYLCRRQFQSLRRGGPSNADEMRVLAKILLWLPNTLDGDGDGLFLPTPRERAVWSRLSASAENCSVRDCPYYHGQGGCFFYRARERAETAHVLVVNHALLLADIATENRVLPAYDHLIVDEAHHLESATTEALHFSIDWYGLRHLLDDLLRGRGKHSGIVDELHGCAGELPREVRNRLFDLLIRLEDAGDTTARRLENLFDTLQIFLDEHTGGQNRNYSVRLRITESVRTQPGWDSVELTWDSTATPFYNLVDGVDRLARAVEDLPLTDIQELETVRARLVAIARRLSETYHQLNALVTEPSDNAIYWLEQRRDGPLAFHTVPLRVGPMVREQLFEKKKTVILTSATLRIAETFDYLRERLEAWEAHEVDVGSPFDYESAALFYVVNDIPEPGQTGYQNAVEQALLNLFQATEGRSLALFTSYSQLRATAEAITKPLTKSDITVYAQGGGSSRAQLLQNFREGKRAVLLGTRSFWEGVDIPGEALSCLVIAKLPFDVPNDPIIAARAEGYDDAFNEYMVPEAVLRFLQGFGRLIRTKTDRGVVAVLDKRLLTKRYGRRFLDSLPGPTVRTGPVSQLPECAALWLAGKPLPDVADPYSDAPWGDEFWDIPPEEPPWWD